MASGCKSWLTAQLTIIHSTFSELVRVMHHCGSLTIKLFMIEQEMSISFGVWIAVDSNTGVLVLLHFHCSWRSWMFLFLVKFLGSASRLICAFWYWESAEVMMGSEATCTFFILHYCSSLCSPCHCQMLTLIVGEFDLMLREWSTNPS